MNHLQLVLDVSSNIFPPLFCVNIDDNIIMIFKTMLHFVNLAFLDISEIKMKKGLALVDIVREVTM